MTHSPPIPAGNQSPYPIQEPPHLHRSQSEPQVATRSSSGISLLAALAIGAGTVLTGAAAVFFLRDAPKPKRHGRKA